MQSTDNKYLTTKLTCLQYCLINHLIIASGLRVIPKHSSQSSVCLCVQLCVRMFVCTSVFLLFYCNSESDLRDGLLVGSSWKSKISPHFQKAQTICYLLLRMLVLTSISRFIKFIKKLERAFRPDHLVLNS